MILYANAKKEFQGKKEEVAKVTLIDGEAQVEWNEKHPFIEGMKRLVSSIGIDPEDGKDFMLELMHTFGNSNAMLDVKIEKSDKVWAPITGNSFLDKMKGKKVDGD